MHFINKHPVTRNSRRASAIAFQPNNLRDRTEVAIIRQPVIIMISNENTGGELEKVSPSSPPREV